MLLDLELSESSSTTLKTEISALYIGSIAKVEKFAPLTAAEFYHTTSLVLWRCAIPPTHLTLQDCFCYLKYYYRHTSLHNNSIFGLKSKGSKHLCLSIN
jgi:hypothetical protein